MFKKCLIFLLILFIGSITSAQIRRTVNNIDYKIIADSLGIHTAPFKFSINNLYQKGNWKGKWIWLDSAGFSKYQHTNTLWLPSAIPNYQALFRKTFTVKKLPESAVLFISGDVLFRVFVNDKLVGRGPVNVGSDYADTRSPNYWYHSSFDVKPYLKKSTNVLAVEVFSTAFEISATTSTLGRFICDLSFNNRPAFLFTDSSWKCNIDILYLEIDPS